MEIRAFRTSDWQFMIQRRAVEANEAFAAGFKFATDLQFRFLGKPPVLSPSIGTSIVTAQELTYNVGATIDATGQAVVKKYAYPVGSYPATTVSNSNAWRAPVDGVIGSHAIQIWDAMVGKQGGWVTGINIGSVPVSFTVEQDGRELAYALGNAELSGLLDVHVVRESSSLLRVDYVRVRGIVSDLYDFNYEDGGRAAQACVVQAGWSPELELGRRHAGQVFRVEVDFETEIAEWTFQVEEPGEK